MLIEIIRPVTKAPIPVAHQFVGLKLETLQTRPRVLDFSGEEESLQATFETLRAGQDGEFILGRGYLVSVEAVAHAAKCAPKKSELRAWARQHLPHSLLLPGDVCRVLHPDSEMQPV